MARIFIFFCIALVRNWTTGHVAIVILTQPHDCQLQFNTNNYGSPTNIFSFFFNSFLAFAWNITRVRRIKQAHRFSYWNIILTIYHIWYMIWTIGYGYRAYAQGIENPTFGLGSLKYSATVKEFLRSKNHNFWFKSECHIVILKCFKCFENILYSTFYSY